MKYFCEACVESAKHFFVSPEKPSNCKITSYSLKDDERKIMDLEKNITILNSYCSQPSTHSLLYIYMLLSELCIDEKAQSKFSELASFIASEQIKSIYV